jgi:hypothetical protein
VAKSYGQLTSTYRCHIKILTHPDNEKHISQIREDFTERVDACGIRPAKLSGFDVVYTCELPPQKPSKTEFVARHDKFIEYNAENPTDWEIFCGLVKPKMVPNFIMINERSSTFMGENGPEVLYGLH